jgi:hypothetical protein
MTYKNLLGHACWFAQKQEQDTVSCQVKWEKYQKSWQSAELSKQMPLVHKHVCILAEVRSKHRHRVRIQGWK